MPPCKLLLKSLSQGRAYPAESFSYDILGDSFGADLGSIFSPEIIIFNCHPALRRTDTVAIPMTNLETASVEEVGHPVEREEGASNSKEEKEGWARSQKI